jgi:two-component system, OmpR family, sensor histidine kinase CiaH
VRRPDARWIHAARVALVATLVVAVVAALLVVGANELIGRDLTHDIDNRLNATLLATAASPQGTTLPVSGHHGDDLDDVPDFVWHVTSSGEVAALSSGAPPLPAHAWTERHITLESGGSSFRYATLTSGDGWLVAGESAIRTHDGRDQILLVELALGALLLLVTFTGSFIVGLRASAPIEQIRRRQAAFTADASHELRTPLSVIQAEVDLSLSRPRPTAEYRAALERIDSESHRLRAIVDDLLWLARADGRVPDNERVTTIDLSAIVATASARFQAVADAGSFTLLADVAPAGTARIRGDQEGVERLVTVLVDNACKYAGSGGTVEVVVAVAAGQVTLTVDDSGPGIPAAAREQIFDRFHRDDQAPGGSGLGLAIADAVVRTTSGSWDVTDSPLGGARFAVEWRLAPTSAPV